MKFRAFPRFPAVPAGALARLATGLMWSNAWAEMGK
jgi:hypothetical protein